MSDRGADGVSIGVGEEEVVIGADHIESISVGNPVNAARLRGGGEEDRKLKGVVICAATLSD